MSPLPSRFFLRVGGASVVAGTLLLAGGVRSARAGAFSLSDQSPSAVATSFAGVAATAEDPSTFFFNPAGMAYLDGVQTEGVYTYIKPQADFSNKGSGYNFGEPIRGSNGGGGARGASLSMGYVTARVLDSEKYGQLALGIGETVPFGLAVDYDPNWVGRYDSLHSELRTLDYGFSAAYKWHFISVGGGFDAQYSSAVLSNAIDFGLLGFANHIPGFAPGNADGSVRLEGSDVSFGFNVGGIVEYLQPGWVPGLGLGKLGVAYRSGITQDLSGRATFRNVPTVFSEISTAFQGQNAEATLKLPEVYNFSVAQDFLHHFTLLGSLTWTRWGRLQSIPISFSNPVTEASLISNASLNTPGIATNYKDAFRYSGGLEYRLLNDRLTLRVGGGYDETPVPDETVRSSRVPDGDRILVSTGLKYHVLDFNSPIFRARVGADVEVAYLHEFVSTEPLVNTVDTSGHVLHGSYNEHVDVVSTSLIFHYGPQAAEPAPKEGKDAKDRSK